MFITDIKIYNKTPQIFQLSTNETTNERYLNILQKNFQNTPS